MKRQTCLVLGLVFLICTCVSAYAMVPENMGIMPCGSNACSHDIHIRTGANELRYVYENESVHLKQEVFKAVCAECGKDSQTIIDSQTVELHSWELKYDYCNRQTGYHEYIYSCACRENSFKVRCTGIHEGAGVQSIETELEVGE